MHHVGPVPEDFIRDKRARQRALSKRLKGFEEKVIIKSFTIHWEKRVDPDQTFSP